MADPTHFDGVAESYAGARPPYPAALWRDVLATGLVTPGRRALELGAGSGEATRALLEHGMDVVAVEPGHRLAAILEERLPRATVIRCRAEDLDPDSGSFDLAVAATSIHWMDLGVVLPMIHRCLAPGGRLLVWRNVFGDSVAAVTPFRREVERIVARRGVKRAGRPEDAEVTADKLTGSGLFTIESLTRYAWEMDLSTAQVRALFGTFSDWTPSEVEHAAAEVDALGGRVTEHYSSWLISAIPARGDA